MNGCYVPHGEAAVHIDDRGYQFGDGVYEVILVRAGKQIDRDGHLARLAHSLAFMEIEWPVSQQVLDLIIARLVARNHLKHGIIYIQVTRGIARRDHKFPHPAPAPSLILTAKHLPYIAQSQMSGMPAITVPDLRWARRDIKTIQLLPNCLAKQKAAEVGAYEAIMILPDGTVSEGASSNVWIVTDENELITRPTGTEILAGITREAVRRLAMDCQLKVTQRAFTKEEMLAAREVFLTSASLMVTSILSIDDIKIGNGLLGHVAIRLRDDYISKA